MKNYAILLVVLSGGCKLPSYHYLNPTVTTATYSHSGEVQAGIQFGSGGALAKGGVAVSKNININGWASFFPETDNGYNSRELEFSLGFQSNPRNNRVTSIWLGLGNGDNEKDNIGLAGSFNRPFIQIQRGAYDLPFFRTKARYDTYLGMRLNYLDYNGKIAGADFDDNLFFYEPYFGAAIGGKNVRLEIIQGFSIKGANWQEGVRIFPYWANIGLLVKFRKR